MQSLIQKWPSEHANEHPFMFPMLPVPLSNVPFHANTEKITRYISEQFPVHLAVHEVSLVETPPPAYTQPHRHDDFDEINIIIAAENLWYKIQLGTEEYVIGNNACIWIPRGMLHSANVLKGSGYFIALRLN